ncbi:hypothetical protein CVT26_014098 [Gymnopilus dilepis]|uniref:Uncharacterized protein n=1 Tax=Gymnopilus dilepis TaxID=231916 RepID=A0A409Y827_9AGAR|nr:hypothetical protein CVT26_014098 [Gymnopilus dilepis]
MPPLPPVTILATEQDDPILAGLVFILWSYYPKAPFQAAIYLLWRIPKSIVLAVLWRLPKFILVGVLRFLGFGRGGVRRDSYASRYQSAHLRGHIPRDSLFAHLRADGADPPSYNDSIFEDDKRAGKKNSSIWGVFGRISWLIGANSIIRGLFVG